MKLDARQKMRQTRKYRGEQMRQSMSASLLICPKLPTLYHLTRNVSPNLQ
jgi:hypothetical protein